jgi:hypothetical protein
MLSLDFTEEQISLTTGLSKEEIATLRKEWQEQNSKSHNDIKESRTTIKVVRLSFVSLF